MAISLQYQVIYATKGRERVYIPLKVKIFCSAVLAITLLAKVWIRLEITDNGYKLADERHKTVNLDMQRREAELRLSVAKRRDNLLSESSRRLGLQEPQVNQVWKIIE